MEQQKNAALATSNEEDLEAHFALYPLPSDHYETLCRLFSKDRNKTDFKPAQLIALAEACGAECKSISSGFMVKFKKNHIFIPIASTIIISESLEGCLKSKRDENPVLTFHLQHNKDRNLDRGIVAVFKEALEKAGFTDISCCNYSTSRPKMKC